MRSILRFNCWCYCGAAGKRPKIFCKQRKRQFFCAVLFLLLLSGYFLLFTYHFAHFSWPLHHHFAITAPHSSVHCTPKYIVVFPFKIECAAATFNRILLIEASFGVCECVSVLIQAACLDTIIYSVHFHSPVRSITSTSAITFINIFKFVPHTHTHTTTILFSAFALPLCPSSVFFCTPDINLVWDWIFYC